MNTDTHEGIEPLHADNSAEELPVENHLETEAKREEIQSESFADFGLKPEIVAALADAGITHPFPIQAMTLPVALDGHDVIGQAKTGTGKTLGFGLPAINRVILKDSPEEAQLAHPGAPQVLIVVPTRELAVQVANDVQTASRKLPVRVITIYGGRAYEPQIEGLRRGVDIVVGTPGRLIDLYKQKHLNLGDVRMVVLDEADEMLDLGFLPDVETILAATPSKRQTMLFSATMPGPVVAMARQYMSRPTHIRAADPDDDSITKKDIRQVIYRAHQLDKDEVVARILQAEGRGKTIIFTQTKRSAAKLSDELTARGFAAGAIHGDLGQGAREQALRAFRGDKIDVLVATDVAARGIDVENITHVINFQCPDDEKTYLHRVGRTGRAGNKGTAVTFVDWEDVHRWGMINKALGLHVPEPVETYSSSEHLYSDLNIPAGTKGRLPKSEQKLAGLDAEEVEDLGGPDGKRSRQSSGRTSGNRSGGRGSGRSSGQSDRREGNRERKPRSDRNRTDRRRSGEKQDNRAGAENSSSANTPASEGQGEKSARGEHRRRTSNGEGNGRRRRRTRRSAPESQ